MSIPTAEQHRRKLSHNVAEYDVVLSDGEEVAALTRLPADVRKTVRDVLDGEIAPVRIEEIE
jgi:hypothetical protein